MVSPERVELLRQKKEKIEKQLAAIEAREKAKARKEETRLKVLIGGGIIADANIHPEIVELVQEILNRSTKAKRDRELLELKGWLPKK
jgi:muramidase (phage lysozyme)